MLFNSHQFLFLFLPTLLFVYYLLVKINRVAYARTSLLLASLFFYAYWDYRFLPLLLASILFNYWIGNKIIISKSKGLLSLGIGLNIFLLFFFKYFSFCSSVINGYFHVDMPKLYIVLPLGISFFTFTQIAFLVDAFKSKAEKSDPISYGLFVTIFPHLIAGPILHHKAMTQQFKSPEMFRFNITNLQGGISLLIIGLCKKVLVADHLSHMASPIFDLQVEMNYINAWAAAIAYTFQLYYDFSGYSDMAIGLGKMFNIELPINFNSPYKATSLIEFWKRWHITLSQFLRDYLYIPLGGNQRGKFMQMRNLFITMFLGGIWHGAGFTYIAWGALHGICLTVNHLWRGLNISLHRYFGWALTFFVVIIAWVLFRSPDLSKGVQILSAMFGSTFEGENIILSKFQWITLVLIAGLTILLPNSRQLLEKMETKTSWAIALGTGLTLVLISLTKATEFLYYQF